MVGSVNQIHMYVHAMSVHVSVDCVCVCISAVYIYGVFHWNSGWVIGRVLIKTILSGKAAGSVSPAARDSIGRVVTCPLDHLVFDLDGPTGLGAAQVSV